MININNYFIINCVSKEGLYNNMNNHKLLNSLLLSSSIETTNGFNELIPSSFVCKVIILLQYFMTIVITGLFLF